MRIAPRHLVLVIACVAAAPTACGPTRPDTARAPFDARAELDSAAAAMGGLERLRDLGGLRLSGRRSTALPGVSADREHPANMFSEVSVLRDPAAGRAVEHITATLPMRPDPVVFSRTLGGPGAPADQGLLLSLEPERIVPTALASGPVAAGDTMFDGRPARVVRFGEPAVRLFVDARTHLPMGWEASLAYPDDPNAWGVWGDVRTVTHWSGWSLEPEGIRYPRTVAVEKNGLAASRTTWSAVAVDAPVAADSFPAAPARSSAVAGAAHEDVREPGRGLALLRGSYNVLLVGQDSGVVVVEAPVSAGRSREVLAEAHRRFPRRPVRALVLTTAAWPHDAGVREYVARGVPVYVPSAAAPVVRRLVAAPHRTEPDSLESAPRAAVVRVVRDSAVLGGGANRLVLLAPRIPAGERADAALVAYLPGPRVLYAGDLLVPKRFEPAYWRQSWDELRRVAGARGLEPLSVASLHDDPVPWEDVLDALGAEATASR